ncbi:MAG: hypothetical protein FWD17_01280 [Polyangiaceae bacterium]|nr:hypothetical protein [Polyangiaceae bacterium]
MIAWSWEPEHGGLVDQVRVVGHVVVVATMCPRDPAAPGWEHAVVYALDAQTGTEIARRALPDPLPIAAMVFEGGLLHIVAARRGEPIYWYALSLDDLKAQHRRVAAAAAAHHDDVLDAWVTPEGGLWFELDVPVAGATTRAQTYAFSDASGATTVRVHSEREVAEGPSLAHDASAGGRDLFVPSDGRWEGSREPTPPAIARFAPLESSDETADADGELRLVADWATASIVGPRARIHTLGGDGFVYGVASAEDTTKPDRVRVEAFAIDRKTGALRWRAFDDRVAAAPALGDAARTVRRPNGELLFQRFGVDGAPRTPLLCARPDGRLDAVWLGARGRYVLDAALGPLVLAHRESRSGSVEVGGFAVDRAGRLLGRRAVAVWSLDVGDLGGAATVYAGAGLVVVRGLRAVRAVRL